jgi:hypothetical protein
MSAVATPLRRASGATTSHRTKADRIRGSGKGEQHAHRQRVIGRDEGQAGFRRREVERHRQLVVGLAELVQRLAEDPGHCLRQLPTAPSFDAHARLLSDLGQPDSMTPACDMQRELDDQCRPLPAERFRPPELHAWWSAEHRHVARDEVVLDLEQLAGGECEHRPAGGRSHAALCSEVVRPARGMRAPPRRDQPLPEVVEPSPRRADDPVDADVVAPGRRHVSRAPGEPHPVRATRIALERHGRRDALVGWECGDLLVAQPVPAEALAGLDEPAVVAARLHPAARHAAEVVGGGAAVDDALLGDLERLAPHPVGPVDVEHGDGHLERLAELDAVRPQGRPGGVRVVVGHDLAVDALERAHPLLERASRLPDVEDATGLHRADAVEAGEPRDRSITPSALERHPRGPVQGGKDSFSHHRSPPVMTLRSQPSGSVSGGR